MFSKLCLTGVPERAEKQPEATGFAGEPTITDHPEQTSAVCGANNSSIVLF